MDINPEQVNEWPGSHALIKPLREVAEILGVHYNTVYNWVQEGKIECIRVGKSVHFTYDQVIDFINNNRTRVELNVEA